MRYPCFINWPPHPFLNIFVVVQSPFVSDHNKKKRNRLNKGGKLVSQLSYSIALNKTNSIKLSLNMKLDLNQEIEKKISGRKGHDTFIVSCCCCFFERDKEKYKLIPTLIDPH